jgi:hypothetical protein
MKNFSSTWSSFNVALLSIDASKRTGLPVEEAALIERFMFTSLSKTNNLKQSSFPKFTLIKIY